MELSTDAVDITNWTYYQWCRQGGGLKPPPPNFQLMLQAVTTKGRPKFRKQEEKKAFRL